jgi:uncharacterized membrane protein
MGHGHGHDHAEPPALHRLASIALWPAVAVVGVLTLVALTLIWPSGDGNFEDPLLLDADPISATVVSDQLVPCYYDAGQDCRLIGFEMDDGPYAGEFGTIEQGATSPLDVGDGVIVVAYEAADGEVQFSFQDYRRGWPMLILVALFVGAVLALGRWRGIGAIAGLGFSLIVITGFTLPAILDGTNAVTVALVTASLIAFAALFLAHGFEIATAVALLSTFGSLVITAVLARIFVGLTSLTGLTDDSSVLLGGLDNSIDPRGILLAGIVIGALGVLDDVTVTQVSAVWELKRARPEMTTVELMRPALRIGRDHISSTVNTLFLAYAGAALPLLLLFTEAGQGITGVLTREVVATEIVRALVGSIGLVASVPLSTWLAAVVVSGDSH